MTIRARLLMMVTLATLVPGILVGLRFLQDRASAIAEAEAVLSAAARAIAEDLDEKIRGTAQLHYGLARARDLDTRDRAACSRFLSAVREEYPQYTGILTIDPDGSLFCDSLRLDRALDLTDRDYFRRARAAAGGVILEPAFGRLTGQAVLQIAHPVRSDTGQLRFVLLASLNLRRLAENHARQLGGRDILIVDQRGTVMASLSAARESAPGRIPEAGATITGTDLLRLATTPAGAHVGELEGGDGGRQVWAVAGPSAFPDAGVRVMVGLPRHDLVAAANRRLAENLAVLATISVLLFAGVWMLAELSIRRQVGRIAAMATRLGKGELGARIAPPHPKGELGALMAVLNGTAESLERQRAAIDDLNQRLSQAQKMEAVGQLTGGIAHDFNNLLTVILGNAELLAASLGDDARLRMMAEVTAKAAERGAELTNRLLAFARRQPLDPKPTDVNRHLADMDRLLRRTLGEQVEIEMVRAAGLWKALIDPVRLESAVLNLCINARDAMPQGGRLTIETGNVHLDAAYAASQREVEPGQYVMVAVSDTGTGMDKATLERAFEPFFTTKDVGKGSGLGLSMVYGFVKQSSGHVRIYSEPGEGTTVKLYLPRADTEESTEAPAPREAMVHGRSETILLVEDDDLVREHVTGQLAGLGYDIVAARNGPEAIETLKRIGAVDLLFTDVVMPGGMSGRDLAEAARALRPDLKVLFTSGYTENTIVHHGRLSPGVQLLSKPYRRNELAAKVRAVLDQDGGTYRPRGT